MCSGNRDGTEVATEEHYIHQRKAADSSVGRVHPPYHVWFEVKETSDFTSDGFLAVVLMVIIFTNSAFIISKGLAHQTRFICGVYITQD